MYLYILIAILTFLTSLVTFYSGFGLGTILMPIMAIFLPLPLAIILTAVVHLFQNLLKTILLWKSIDWNLAFRFGGVALLAAIPGAWLLKELSILPAIETYSLLGIVLKVTYLKITIGILLMVIAIVDFLSQDRFKFKNLFIGGAISGFLGGISGHQGAFRSLFLIQVKRDQRSFISTNAIIATCVDLVRLVIYSISFSYLIKETNVSLLTTSLAGATVGIILGIIFLKQVTIDAIQILIRCFLIGFGLLLIAGIL